MGVNYSTWATSATRRVIPADVAFDARGNLLVALAGVDEVAITASPEQGPRRIVVGRRPMAVLPSPDGLWAYVADSLDDTISVVEIATGLRPATICSGTATRTHRGRPWRAAVFECQAVARWLDELP